MSAVQESTRRDSFVEACERLLWRHVVDPWFPRSLDLEHGGFLCDFDRAWRPCGSHRKLLEFQARQTVFAAEASRLYPADGRLRAAALHGFRCLRETMWDREMGGWYHGAERSGRPLWDGAKHAHGAAYAIQACVAVHQATGEAGALDLGRRGFDWLETFSHDDEHGGYFGPFARDGAARRLADGRRSVDVIGTPLGWKDLNVQSDLLEVFVDLHGAGPDPRVARRVAEVLDLCEKAMTQAGALHYFFEPDWRPVPHLTRFGFQLQLAFRLLLARPLAGNGERLTSLARRLVDHAIEHGWDERAGGFYYAGPASAPDAFPRHDLRVRTKSWWVQFDGLRALRALSLETGDARYARLCEAQWAYIERSFIDRRRGGIYAEGLDTVSLPRRLLGPGFAPVHFTRKGSVWKDASHDGRALLACIAGARRPAV